MASYIDNEIVSSILQDDLARFKRIHPCRIEMNRFLKPYEYLNPKDRIINSTANNKNNNLAQNSNTICKIQDRPIKGPTALIFAILCERPSFCRYIIEKTNPDLSISVDGWTAFHFSCCTNDTKCLLILLHNEYIQQNIDFPIIAPTFPNNDKKKQTTTALHLAVSNRLYKTVLILTIKPLPTIKKQKKPNSDNQNNNSDNNNNNNNSIENNNNNGNEPPNEEEEYSTIDYASSNVNIRATSGNTPLHIALFNNDFEMCQILTHAGCDPSIKNDDEINCINYARRLNLDDKFIKLMNEELEPDPIDAIINRHFEGKEKDHFYDADYEFEYDENNENDNDTDTDQDLSKYVHQNSKDINLLKQMLHKKEFEDKILRNDLSNVQETTKKLTDKPLQVEKIDDICCICGSSKARRCTQCGRKFCEICFNKKCHSCTV